jgi:hypothetical protein
MTQLMEKALAEVRKLPDQDQDALATLILDEVADERHWAAAFGRSREQLGRMARARRESREGQDGDAIRPPRHRREAEPAEADWFEQALEQFRAIVGLPPGWDSNNATPPDPKLVQVAAALLYRLAKSHRVSKPRINPTRRGGIQFEWEAGSRSLEVEVVSEDCAAYSFQDDLARIEEEGQISPDEPLDMVTGYIQRVAGNP